MFAPTDIDGRTLVILRHSGSRLGTQYRVVVSGRLEHDGKTLSLIGDGSERAITEHEQKAIMVVRADTRISQCRGFDLFLIEEP